MGIIIDSSVLIAGERRGDDVPTFLSKVITIHGDERISISIVTIVEITHGIYRANDDLIRQKRKDFVETLCLAVPIHPINLEIAQLAGKIEGEQAMMGVSIAFPDLLIG